MKPNRPAVRWTGTAALLLLFTGCSVESTDGATGRNASVDGIVTYEIAFPNRVHHEAEITVTFTDLPAEPLEIRMSRTSPGRYALHEFAKNVYGVEVSGAGGRDVRVHRPDPHQWTVSDHGGEVTFHYTLFGDRADGTYTGIDETHGHLNIPATFVWARGLEDRPVELRVDLPEGEGWRVATQLEATDSADRFRAPDLAYFLDSPTLVGPWELREWSVPGPSGDQTIRIAIHHDGSETDVDRYAEAVRRIVGEIGAMFGEYPEFDYGEYTFLANYLPWVSGDGMEHRNSTVLTSTQSIRGNQVGVLGTVAHEFIHAWNIERIRPVDFEPFDFEEADMSTALWFGEGFTSYMDDVALVRAGVIDFDEFAARLGRAVNTVANSPGRGFFSPMEMSMQAPFVDAAVSVDPQNRSNTFISYYTWGSVVGLGLDLTLRTRFDLELEDYMQAVWSRFGDPSRGYTIDQLEETLAELTSDEGFAREFFDAYVGGSELPDFAALFSHAGVDLVRAAPERGTVGPVSLAPVDGGLRVTGSTRIGTPLYGAGVNRGDVLISANGRELTSVEEWHRAVDGLAVGDTVDLEYESRGTRSAVVLEAAPDIGLRAFARQPNEAESEFRSAWTDARRSGN